MNQKSCKNIYTRLGWSSRDPAERAASRDAKEIKEDLCG